MAKVLCCQLLATLAAVASGIRLETTGASAAADHPWPTSRGPHLKQFGLTNVVVPHDLSASLAWSWHHPDGQYHTVLCGGPVIDAAGNFYVSANDGVRKLSPTGQALWHFKQPDNMLNNQPALLGDKLFGNNQYGVAFAVDLKTGASVWSKRLAETAGGHCGYPAAYDGVFVVGAEESWSDNHRGGNNRVFGLDAASGRTLWEFKPRHPVWSFTPLFPGDGTCVFMDYAGGMYRVGLQSGTQRWYAPPPGASKSFSDGGATLGPNGVVYSCSNPGSEVGGEGGNGLLRALRLADGALMWQKVLPQPCNSFPAVGHLAQGQGLSVAVTPGSLMGEPNLHGSIMAFDAATGMLEWRFNAEPYTGSYNMARGDVEGFHDRNQYDENHGVCMPAHWSAANVAGDGTVLAARSDGYVYAVSGPAQPPPAASLAEEAAADFASTPGAVARLWDAKGASLHGAFAFAPGTMAVQTCDTLYVFRV